MQLKERSIFLSMILYCKIILAYWTVRLFYRNDREAIVLVGGNLGEKYEDNAAVFHRYLVEHYSDKMEIYWLYDPSFSYIEEHNIPHAVPLGSFRNYVLFFRAQYSIHGHSIIYDIAPMIDRFIFLNKKTKMLHISHGIECFKKILIQKEDVPLLARCDVFNCASQYEKDIKQNEWGIPEEKLVITGMARFDRLQPNSPPIQVKRVLVMFTWREWLFDLTEEEFLNSDYFQSTFRLLDHPKFRALVANKQLDVIVALHPFMKKYETYFKKHKQLDGNVTFYSFDELSISEEMRLADMLITDYSSISWDFLYMNKPIIFYTFDQREFLMKRGSYLDLDRDLYGYKATNAEEVIGYLKEIVIEGNTANPFFPKAYQYIDYFDQRNCERLAMSLFSEVPAVHGQSFSCESDRSAV